MPLDVLVKAATNPLKEENEQNAADAAQRRQTTLAAKGIKTPAKPWSIFLRELRVFAIMKLATGPTPLPNVLRNPDRLGVDILERIVRVRLRNALDILIERSLVSVQDSTDDLYSMHSLVHEWVRRRSKMRTALQSLWCQISMTTLALSIPRPVYGAAQDEVQSEDERRKV
ncbi:hypothetical protein Sste5346_008346 [Sporothrix stenoceras]|uniref:Uncharacterized protein n=1 Tax=Sporothrix stenoceras TaxID=5173 RepID=A0ABR3YSM3_9PEZI